MKTKSKTKGRPKGKFWSFKRARAYVRKLGIKSYNEWEGFCLDGFLKPKSIPSTPYNIYKNDGWLGWKDWLNHNRLPGARRRYSLNENFFKKWSHNMAYILGFWFADGHIDIKANVFSITQHISDQYLLKEILKKMGSNSRLIHHNNCVVLRINSKTIVKDIIAIGGKPAKSLDCVFPTIPNEYLPDFIRGLWDGDGCISNSKWRGYDYYRASLFSGSSQFIRAAKEIINKNIPLTKGFIGTAIQKTGTMVNGWPLSRDSIVYRFVLGINDTRRLRDYIYQHNGLKLDRKYKKFIKAGAIKFTKPVTTIDYPSARKYSLGLGLRSKTEWFEYFKIHKRPNNIPANPLERYKNKGWVNWYHWLGKIKEDFLSFEMARKIVRGFRFGGRCEYHKWLQDNPIKNIPSAPFMVYKKEWVDWYDWLGKKRPLSKEKLLKSRI